MNICGYYLQNESIVCCRVLNDGRLKEFAAVAAASAGLLAVDPNGRWLCIAPRFDPPYFAADYPPLDWRKTTRLRFYALDERGLPGKRTDVTVRATAIQLVVCPTGRRLYVNGGNAIVVVAVSARGVPRVESVKQIDCGYQFVERAGDTNTTYLSVSPDGGHLFHYVGLGFEDIVGYLSWLYRVNSRGKLAPVGPKRINGGPGESNDIAGWMELMRDGKTMIVGERSNVRFALWSGGQFKNPKLLSCVCTGVTLDPKDRFVFVNDNSTEGSISIFRKKAPGKLTLVGRQTGIREVAAIEPLGRFAYENHGEPGKGYNSLRVWRILESGRLQFVASGPSRENLRFAAR